ncbi:MAG: AraC family transcriptional regulator [Provencibacterium sp.]|jgi:AraC-like DNA-binding protein|nr:AraC family transcriptional regulator [Provencibacterium sp.]
MPGIYEAHRYSDPALPIFFHRDTVGGGISSSLHWHEAVELLYCYEGSGTVLSDGERIPLTVGELAVVNANCLHAVYAERHCRYDCLIASPGLFAGLDLPLPHVRLQSLVRDERFGEGFSRIGKELREARPYYRTAVRTAIAELYLLLCREYAIEDPAPDAGRAMGRLDLCKEVIAYLRQHYAEEIAIDDLCRAVGFSKYYLCHTFKELTGQTVVGYLNFLRCTNARSLLATGEYNITESARLCGFHNLSYFTRTYKRQMGELPSAQKGE